MSIVRFEITLSIHGERLDTGIIDIDQKVLDAVDDEWRSHFYDLNTDEEIAEMIFYNMAFYRIGLDMMDGWADQPWNAAKIVKWPDLTLMDHTAKKVKHDD